MIWGYHYFQKHPYAGVLSFFVINGKCIRFRQLVRCPYHLAGFLARATCSDLDPFFLVCIGDMGDCTNQFYDELLISHYKGPYFHQPVEWHVEVLSETGPFMDHFYPKNPYPPPMQTPNPKQVVSRPHDIPKILTHRIHVWYIYLHLP